MVDISDSKATTGLPAGTSSSVKLFTGIKRSVSADELDVDVSYTVLVSCTNSCDGLYTDSAYALTC